METKQALNATQLSALEALAIKIDENIHPLQLQHMCTVDSVQCSVGVLQEPVWPEQILCQPIADKHQTSTSFNSTKEERKGNNKEENKTSYLSFLRQQGKRSSYAERNTIDQICPNHKKRVNIYISQSYQVQIIRSKPTYLLTEFYISLQGGSRDRKYLNRM